MVTDINHHLVPTDMGCSLCW